MRLAAQARGVACRSPDFGGDSLKDASRMSCRTDFGWCS